MSIINNGLLLASEAAAAGGYQVSRSLRFNSSDSGFCSRTFTSAGNRKTWTWAGWVKRSKLGEFVRLFNNTASGANAAIQFMDSDKLRLFDVGIGLDLQTTQVFRDASAWYHFVIVLDTTQATSSNRAKLYVNGSQITTFSTSTYPSQNTDGAINNNVAHQIGSLGGSSEFFNGYLADIHFIDGQALTPSSFAETDATTGQWIPKLYTGSYGTNGFRLPFSDNSGTTSTTLGKDSAGSNNWTPNNFSVAAGAGNDSLVDTPTSYGTDTGAGGEVRGNYATFNPLDLPTSGVYSNGNLEFNHTGGGGVWRTGLSTFAVSSGKWYWEMVPTVVADSMIGIVKADWSPTANSSQFWDSAGGYGYLNSNGNKYNNGSGASYGATFTTNDVIGVALDLDAGTLVFYKNGVSQGTAYSSLSGTFKAAFGAYQTCKGIANFGQRPFAYTAPSGFKALCDTNLPAPVVAKPNTVMDVSLWTGNGTQTVVTGLQYSPDFVWIKSRSTSAYHMLFDTVRGAQARLHSNTTDQEQTGNNDLTAFNSDGYTLDNNSAPANTDVNGSGTTYVGWSWDAGTSTVTNTQGSITSSVRANASAGFSIVTYTSTGSSQTAGHGLGVASPFIIQKRRDGTGDWYVGTTLVDGSYDILLLNTLAAKSDAVGVSAPTSTVFSTAWFGTGSENWVAYCFAPVSGYSSFGSYTGNGSTDGPFVYTGFRPRWVLIKASSAGPSSWNVYDAARSVSNPVDKYLFLHTSDAEGTYAAYDLLSNGFKIKQGDAGTNFNGATYIYAAFAESPFQYARAR